MEVMEHNYPVQTTVFCTGMDIQCFENFVTCVSNSVNLIMESSTKHTKTSSFDTFLVDA